MNPFVTANGKPVAAQLPCPRGEFPVAQKLPPRSFLRFIFAAKESFVVARGKTGRFTQRFFLPG
jgi:hypothetical protein